MQRPDVLAILYDLIERFNEVQAPERPLPCAADTQLYGHGGHLDSLALVSFLLDVEEAVAERTGRQLVLADERAMAQHRNPFRDVGSLADYILLRLEEAA
jgi:hypothetical protein